MAILLQWSCKTAPQLDSKRALVFDKKSASNARQYCVPSYKVHSITAGLPLTCEGLIQRNNGAMSTPHRHLYLAFYDVAHPRRLAAALKLSRSYSVGGQKSVHELFMTNSERDTLVKDMFALLKPEEDRFQIMALDPRSKIYTLGKAVKPVYPSCMYVG